MEEDTLSVSYYPVSGLSLGKQTTITGRLLNYMRISNTMERFAVITTVICTAAGCLVQTASTAAVPKGSHSSTVHYRMHEDELYPYGGAQFTRFVSESFETVGSGTASDFYNWFQKAYDESSYKLTGTDSLDLKQALRLQKRRLSEIHTPSKKAHAELAISAQLHRMVKKTIPKFSLDRGFEFYYTVKNGERQCFLQSVLISGLLQDMGINAGVAMVWRNTRGENINNAHAVCVVKLANNSDVIVDASEPEPFPKQQGLFLRLGDYRFLRPVYGPSGEKIYYYRTVDGHQKVKPNRVKTLDVPFIVSQFWYYRGERTPGALFSQTRTPEGLEQSVRFLQTSQGASAANPLATYMLGRIYLLQGKQDLAEVQFREAYRLYSKYGWVPDGPSEFYKSSTRGKAQSSGKAPSSSRRYRS